MIRWLEDNPVGQALTAAAGILVLVMLSLGVFWTLPPTGSGSDPADGGGVLRLEVPELEQSEPIDAYAVVTERPVFNESRQPELALDADSDDLADLEETDVDAPELELSGVIITPSIKMVTLRQKEAGESLVAFEGQPLEGNYGSWHVSHIAPREITLSSGDGEEMQLALEVHDAQMAPPPKPEPAREPASRQAAASGADDDAPLSRAEEIRQRIQERREELRRAAEEARESGAEDSDDYRSAIQSMINARSRQEQNEDEQ